MSFCCVIVTCSWNCKERRTPVYVVLLFIHSVRMNCHLPCSFSSPDNVTDVDAANSNVWVSITCCAFRCVVAAYLFAVHNSCYGDKQSTHVASMLGNILRSHWQTTRVLSPNGDNINSMAGTLLSASRRRLSYGTFSPVHHSDWGILSLTLLSWRIWYTRWAVVAAEGQSD